MSYNIIVEVCGGTKLLTLWSGNRDQGKDWGSHNQLQEHAPSDLKAHSFKVPNVSIVMIEYLIHELQGNISDLNRGTQPN